MGGCKSGCGDRGGEGEGDGGGGGGGGTGRGSGSLSGLLPWGSVA